MKLLVHVLGVNLVLLPSCGRSCGELKRRMRCLWVLFLVAVAWSPAAAADVVSGTASYRERIALPPGAVFEAVLEDVTVADAPSIELGRTTIPDPGNPPFSFEIDYDPLEVNPAHTYSVRAQVSVGRKLIFVSDKMNPVLTAGAPIRGRGVDDQGRRDRAGGAGGAAADRGARAAAAGDLRRRPAVPGLRGARLPPEPLARPGVPSAADLGGQGRAARFGGPVGGGP